MDVATTHPPVGKLLVPMWCTKCEEQATENHAAAGASSVQMVSVNLQAETMRGSDLVCGSGENLALKATEQVKKDSQLWNESPNCRSFSQWRQLIYSCLNLKHHCDAPYILDSSSYRISCYQYNL